MSQEEDSAYESHACGAYSRQRSGAPHRRAGLEPSGNRESVKRRIAGALADTLIECVWGA